MVPPRPTRRMFGYFSEAPELPAELRGQNLFHSTDDDYLYCIAAGKPVLLRQVEALVSKGLVIEEHQVLVKSRRGATTAVAGLEVKSKGKTVVLVLAVALMLGINIYAFVFMK